MMRYKRLFLCGIGAAVVYTFTVLLGGALRPGYDHLVQPISELTAAGAQNKPLLDMLFLVYNVLLIGFGIGVFGAAAAKSNRVSGVALAISGVCGVLLQLFFPQDPGGAQAAVTTTGNLHIAFAGLAAFASMLAVVAVALWFRSVPDLRRHAIFSLVVFVVMLVSGGAGAAAAAGGFTFFGLVERITIGAFILWQFVIGRALYTIGDAAQNSNRTIGAYHASTGD